MSLSNFKFIYKIKERERERINFHEKKIIFYSNFPCNARVEISQIYMSLLLLYRSWIQVTLGVTLINIISLNIFLLDENFDISIVVLHFFLIISMLAKFQDDLKSITISSIKCLNVSFCISKL